MSLFSTKSEKKSFGITAVIAVLLLLFLIFFGFKYLDPPTENGIAINFGTTDTGSGDVQPTTPVEAAPQPENTPQPETSTPQTTPDVTDDVTTQEAEEAPVIEEKKEEQKVVEKPKEEPKKEEKEEVKEKTSEEKQPKEEVKPAPKPDRSTSDALNSLINGAKSDGKKTTGEGDDASGGDKGNPNGDPNATSYYGQGKGLDGDGNYRLGGRKALNKEKFVQDCNESGIVVVKIEVNQQGQVISATPGVKGTTNTNPCLLNPAKKAALATRFNSDADAPIKQVGTIIYEFKLSE
ncbi:MAG: energy transducer TonB [Mesonia hippocampi]|uniref:energy transducer TonB n=1 Tax=Mesonia hippocampi TaxID=1628250 RepID=UPI003F945B6B